ncbi:class I SAM-dependent methyltransferase [Bacillus sp. 1P10SD]|uniref:class I SAM-dependent methyltransferase n=1 Tax=Bacillus sp. 1P10SD TaxID=3132265 RepID=UPI0039A44A96
MALINRVKEFIDGQYSKPRGLIGTYFGEKMVRQHKLETLWTLELLKVAQGECVLELGCGAGYAMKLILEQTLAAQVVGLDLSATVIRSAAFRNKKAIDEERAKLVHANVEKLPCQNEHFDKVFSIHTIYFWDNIAETFLEIYRVLKPGGFFVVTLCDGKHGEVWEGVKNMIEDQLIPSANKSGFQEVTLVEGPNSRQFRTVAVIGNKKPNNKLSQ